LTLESPYTSSTDPKLTRDIPIPDLNDSALSKPSISGPTVLIDEQPELQPPTQAFVVAQLRQQIPALDDTEATTLSQMLTPQLRKWTYPSTTLLFRRTKIRESTSTASVTIIDFECCATLQPRTGFFFREQSRQVRWTSTLVTSHVPDAARPDDALTCLWAPAYDGKEGAAFGKEGEHLRSVFGGCVGMGDGRDRFLEIVALRGVGGLFERDFGRWEDGFGGVDEGVQRACAWGVVAAKSREIEYRLFAACLTAFLEFEVQRHRGGARVEAPVENDLLFNLVPAMRIGGVDVGILALSEGSDGSSFRTGWGTYAPSTRDRTTGLGHYSQHDMST
jgi:hypothetical protein